MIIHMFLKRTLSFGLLTMKSTRISMTLLVTGTWKIIPASRYVLLATCSRHRRPDCWSSRADNMLHFRAALECFMHAISRPEDPFLDQSWTLLANQHSNKLQVGSRRKVRQHLMLIFQANSPRINPKWWKRNCKELVPEAGHLLWIEDLRVGLDKSGVKVSFYTLILVG